MAPSRDLTIPHWLDVAARNFPERTALLFGSDVWSFTELRHAVDAAAGCLAGMERLTGARIGILASNRPGFVFAVHAAARIRTEVVPLNWRQTADELTWQIRDAEIGVLVVDEERRGAATAACADLPVTILAIEKLEDPGSGAELRTTDPSIDLTRGAAILYTSGTSGRPKGARLTYGNLWFAAVASALHLGQLAGDRWLASMPLYHVGGLSMLFRGAISGVSVDLHERFDPKRVNAAIDRGATLVSAVPAMLERLLDERGGNPWPGHLRCVLLGGAAGSWQLIERCLATGLPVAPTYGLTEAASQVTTLLPDQVAAQPGSAGAPLPLLEVRISDRGDPVEAGQRGEIEVRGPTVFAGYLGDPGRPPNLSDDGWLRTGDLGYFDKDGFLFVLDRRDDLIVSGGENVYPAEVERVLLSHPNVRDVAVVGVPDDRWGAVPVAAVVWNGEADLIDGVWGNTSLAAREGQPSPPCPPLPARRERGIADGGVNREEASDHPEVAAEKELRAYCAQRLARFKIPARWLEFAELPRTGSGKVQRGRLREMVLERLADDSGSDR